MDLGRKAEAKEALVEALRLEPTNKQVKDGLDALSATMALSATGTIPVVEPSESAFREELARHPESVPLHQALADTYLSEGRYEQAKVELRRIVTLDPKQMVAWAKLGNVHVVEKQLDRAQLVFQEALKVEPANATIWNEQGLLYQRQGQRGQALEAFIHAAAGTTVPVQVWFNLGGELAFVGRKVEALAALNRFLHEWRGSPATRAQAENAVAHLEGR